MSRSNTILEEGIWKKAERQLISQVKLYPPLYEVNGLTIYGKEKYDSSWDAVSKQLGLPGKFLI